MHVRADVDTQPTTDRFYDLEYVRRPKPTVSLQTPSSAPIPEHYDTGSQVGRRQTPSSDDIKMSAPHRKRVPVAVSQDLFEYARRLIENSASVVGNAKSSAVVMRAMVVDVSIANKQVTATHANFSG